MGAVRVLGRAGIARSELPVFTLPGPLPTASCGVLALSLAGEPGSRLT